MRLSFSSRFWLFAPLAFFLAVASIAMLHWWRMADAIGSDLDRLNGHEVVPGITLSFTGKNISGFPFNLDITLAGLAIEGEGAHGAFRWTAEKFAAHRLTYGRRQYIYEAAGNQTLSWTDAGARKHGLTFLPGTMRASMLAGPEGLMRFDLEVIDAGGHDSDGTAFTAAHFQFHMRRDPKADAVNLMVSGQQIQSKASIAGLFGPEIKTLSLYANLTQGGAFAPLLAGKSRWAAASEAWRRAGGEVTIGPVTIAASNLNMSAGAFGNADDGLRGLLSPLY